MHAQGCGTRKREALRIGKVRTAAHLYSMQIYGPDASPEMVLSGQISPPPEFEILYSLINKLAASAVDELEDPLIST